jgi:hypothetical protein
MATDKSKRCGEAFVEATLRDKITGPLRKLSEKVRATGVALSVAADVDAVVRSVGSDTITAPLAKIKQEMAADMKRVAADMKVELKELDAAWEKEFGEPYPRDFEAVKKLAALAGMNGQTLYEGKFTEADVFPIIEGCLQRLANERAGVAKKRRPKGGQKKRKRGNAEDETRALDLGCQYIVANGKHKISKSELANIIGCPKSVFSSKEGKPEFAKAIATAKDASGQVRQGFSTDDHQADAGIDDDWQTQIDDRIDAG